jgi:hypothetical protein
MNATNLVRHYDALTPWERLPLIVAAAGRGDEVEGQRLVRSAPRLQFGIADCWGLVQGLDHLAKHYLLVQLDRAALYWRVMDILDQEPGATRQWAWRFARLRWAAVGLVFLPALHLMTQVCHPLPTLLRLRWRLQARRLRHPHRLRQAG